MNIGEKSRLHDDRLNYYGAHRVGGFAGLGSEAFITLWFANNVLTISYGAGTREI